METTILVAKLLGVYFTVSGIFVVTRGKTLTGVIKDLFEHRAITYVVGAILLLGGSALVLRGDTGNDPLSLFVTVVAWAILIKGIAYILAPEWLHDMAKRMPTRYFPILGALVAVIGLYLLFFIG
ncbi:MAG: DUF308 domain-containing protein [Patescibacteria group bacterium]